MVALFDPQAHSPDTQVMYRNTLPSRKRDSYVEREAENSHRRLCGDTLQVHGVCCLRVIVSHALRSL